MNAVAHDLQDEIALVLSYYQGDTRAAIKAIAGRSQFLSNQIAIACMAAGHRYTRGWNSSLC